MNTNPSVSSYIERIFEIIWTSLPSECTNFIKETHLVDIACKLVKENYTSEEFSLDHCNHVALQKAKQFVFIQKRLQELKDIPHVPQRSLEWLERRKNRLTASDLAQALGKGKYGSRQALLQKKAKALLSQTCVEELLEKEGSTQQEPVSFMTMAPMKWGTMFEPMILRTYSQMNHDIEVFDFGLLPHRTIDCFGASPDGITCFGKMVEIKCPWKRKIEGGTVPDYYYLQIQGQLAVCELEECDYIEVVMEDIQSETEYYELVPHDKTRDHGVIIELQTVTTTSVEDSYEYSPPYLTPSQAYTWAKDRAWKLIEKDPDVNITRIRPWCVKDINMVSVKFNREEWETIVPQIYKFWQDVLDLKDKYEKGEVPLVTPKKPRKNATTDEDGVKKTMKSKYQYRTSDNGEDIS